MSIWAQYLRHFELDPGQIDAKSCIKLALHSSKLMYLHLHNAPLSLNLSSIICNNVIDNMRPR